jgi:hypothetical protein
MGCSLPVPFKETRRKKGLNPSNDNLEGNITFSICYTNNIILHLCYFA